MKISLKDLEKAINYARTNHAEIVEVSMSGGGMIERFYMEISEAYKGAGSKITIYAAESSKMPTITKTETLFE